MGFACGEQPEAGDVDTAPAPAGSPRARLEEVRERLPVMHEQVIDSATALADAEARARREDPELARLYRELVDIQIAYRATLTQTTVYAEAMASNTRAVAEYQALTERRDTLKEEIANEREE